VSFFSFRVAPGVRVGVSKRGVRTSIGPRAARMHVGGGYRTGLSTGAGPFTLYQSVGHTRRKPRTVTARAAAGRTRTRGPAQATIAAHQREVARAAKADAAEQIQAAFTALTEVHRHPVAPVHPPVAPGPGPVDEAAIRTRSDNVALAGIRPWHLRARGVAKATAAVAAEQEINAARFEAAAEHARVQADLDRSWHQLCANDHDTVIATLAEAFEDNEAHAAAVGVVGDEVTVVAVVPNPGIVPDAMLERTPAGNIGRRKLTKTVRNSYYLDAVCGHVLAATREAFAVAPSINGVRIAAVRLGGPDVYGRTVVECLLAAHFTRTTLDGVAWDTTSASAIFTTLAGDPRLNVVGVAKECAPLDLSAEPELAAMLAAVDLDELEAID
jgi:hypothetical protein